MSLGNTKEQIADAVSQLIQVADSVRQGWRDVVQARFYQEYLDRTAQEWHGMREELERLEAEMRRS